MRVAYVTADSCGSGHAVRGIALVEAAARARVGWAGAPAISRRSSVSSTEWSATQETPSVESAVVVQRGAPPILRAFGPPVHRPAADLTGYEASTDWRLRVLQWQPDLLIGDLRAGPLETLRIQLGVPAWLLMRIWPREYREPAGWRVIAIEPGVDPLMGIRESIPPIVGRQRVWPDDGQEMEAGYNAWFEAIRYGYHSRVRWTADRPERRRRIEAGGGVPAENGADVLVWLIQKAIDTRYNRA